MKANVAAALLSALWAATVKAAPAPTVDTTYGYRGPTIPVGDWVDPTVNGNGKGFPRLVEPPAVKPAMKNPANNVNVVQLSYLPTGINIHYQTPFGLGELPTIMWGTSAGKLSNKTQGYTHTYVIYPLHV
jgi:acid phosphatase